MAHSTRNPLAVFILKMKNKKLQELEPEIKEALYWWNQLSPEDREFLVLKAYQSLAK